MTPHSRQLNEFIDMRRVPPVPILLVLLAGGPIVGAVAAYGQVAKLAETEVQASTVARAAETAPPVDSPPPAATGQAGEPETAADAAGIQPGDVITHMDSRSLRSVRDMLRELGRHRPGETVPLVVVRKGTAYKADLTFGRRGDLMSGLKYQEQTQG